MFEWVFSTDGWIAFATLFAMEVVLGIDNIVFISILAGKLPVSQQANARYIGLGLALIMRIALLFAITWIIGLTEPLVSLFGRSFSGRDLVLLFGGLFLIGKATLEIHHMVEGHVAKQSAAGATFGVVIAQIVAIDIVFSIDSIITAVGLTRDIGIMIAAVIASMAVMLVAAGPLSDFVNRHPTAKMLALAFLVLIGATLVAHAFHFDIPKGYVYGAMAFAVLVEALNIWVRSSASEGASGDAVPATAVDQLVTRAFRQGATSIQIIADDLGLARAWIASPKSIIEDKSFPALPWNEIRPELEKRAVGARSIIDGAQIRTSSVLAPADMRPAAVLTWQKG